MGKFFNFPPFKKIDRKFSKLNIKYQQEGKRMKKMLDQCLYRADVEIGQNKKKILKPGGLDLF